MGYVATYTNSSTRGHHGSREILEAPALCRQIYFTIAHGKSWNCSSLKIAPDRVHEGDWESHAGIIPSTLVTKPWT